MFWCFRDIVMRLCGSNLNLAKGLQLGSIQGDLAKLIRRFAVGCVVQPFILLKKHVFDACAARRFGCLLLAI